MYCQSQVCVREAMAMVCLFVGVAVDGWQVWPRKGQKRPFGRRFREMNKVLSGSLGLRSSLADGIFVLWADSFVREYMSSEVDGVAQFQLLS